jgi:hypothetical protein
LLRLVVSGEEIVPDPQARLPGRGAYLHPSQICFEQAERRRVFPRALRVPGPLGTGMLGDYLAGLPGPGGTASDHGVTAGEAGFDCDERSMRTRR